MCNVQLVYYLKLVHYLGLCIILRKYAILLRFPYIAYSLTMNNQNMMYKTSQKTSVQPRAFAGLNSSSSLLSSGELKQFDMFTWLHLKKKPTHKHNKRV